MEGRGASGDGERERERETDRQTDRQTDRETDRETVRQGLEFRSRVGCAPLQLYNLHPNLNPCTQAKWAASPSVVSWNSSGRLPKTWQQGIDGEQKPNSPGAQV